MPDPGFDFTRGGIGAEPLPPIDFSAGFKYLQDQQALALQQSRALLSHQGKMAELSVESDKNQIRRAELFDKALTRKHDSEMLNTRLVDNDKQRALKLIELQYGRDSDIYRRGSQQILIKDREKGRTEAREIFDAREKMHQAGITDRKAQRILDEDELTEATAKRRDNTAEIKEKHRLQEIALRDGRTEAAAELGLGIARLIKDGASLWVRERELQERIVDGARTDKTRQDQLDVERAKVELDEQEHELNVIIAAQSNSDGGARPPKLFRIQKRLESGDVKTALQSLGTLKDAKGKAETLYLPLFKIAGVMTQVVELLEKDKTGEFSQEVHEAFGEYISNLDKDAVGKFDGDTSRAIGQTSEDNVFSSASGIIRDKDEPVAAFASRLIQGLSQGFASQSSQVMPDDSSTPLLYGTDEENKNYDAWADVYSDLETHSGLLASSGELMADLHSVLFDPDPQVAVNSMEQFSNPGQTSIVRRTYNMMWDNAETTEEKFEVFKLIAGKAGYDNVTEVVAWAEELIDPVEGGEGVDARELVKFVGSPRALVELHKQPVFDPTLTKARVNELANPGRLTLINNAILKGVGLGGPAVLSGMIPISQGGKEEDVEVDFLYWPEPKRFIANLISGRVRSNEEIAKALLHEFEFLPNGPKRKEDSGALLLMGELGGSGNLSIAQIGMQLDLRKKAIIDHFEVFQPLGNLRASELYDQAIFSIKNGNLVMGGYLDDEGDEGMESVPLGDFK